MAFVAVMGAGGLGAGIARRLVERGRVSEVRLIDDAGDVAVGKALDIQQAAAIDGSATRISGSDDPTRAVGAAAVLIADRATSDAGRTEIAGDEACAIVRNLVAVDRDAVVIYAGTAQQDALERSLFQLRLDRRKCFGSAPWAVVASVQALIAIEADISPTTVSLAVLGRVPDGIVIPWRDATIAGLPAVRTLTAAQLARIERWAHARPAPGDAALATVAARASEMVLGGSRNVVCCSVGLEGELGIRRKVASVPVVIGRGGISRIALPTLDGREQVRLENALGPS